MEEGVVNRLRALVDAARHAVGAGHGSLVLRGADGVGVVASGSSAGVGVLPSLEVPVEYEGRVLGHLTLAAKDGPFSDEDELIATSVATLAAVFLVNASDAAADRRRLRELEDLDRVRRDFVAIASHELAQPAAGVLGWLETLDGHWGRLEDDRRRDMVGRALRQSREMLNRLETVLDVSRVEAGRLEVRAEDVDLGEVASTTVELLGPDDVRRVDVVRRPAPCRGERRLLVRVTHNLVVNALKYSPPDTRVRVETAELAAGAELTVSDDGRGFAPDEAVRLFDRYYRAEAVAAAPGLGLGLYVSHQIVEAHGGRIEAASDGEGRGARFRYWIPGRPRPAGEPAASRPISSTS